MKRRSAFEEFVLPELKPRTAVALERAQALTAYFGQQTPFHQRNPCTAVHVLVDSLIENGGQIQ